MPSAATTLAAVAFAMLFGIHWGDPRLPPFFLSVLMSQLSISSLNDWADRDLDAASGRWRPLPMGRIAPPVALGLALLFAVLGLPAALASGAPALACFGLGLAAGWSYDLFLKRTSLSFLPFAVAFPLLPIWAGLVAGRALPGLLIFFLVGAPLAIAIHVADSIADLASDAASGVRNLVVTLGRGRSLLVMQAALLLGSLVVVMSFVHWILAAILAGATALTGVWLVARTAAVHPDWTRWAVTATALAIAIPWLAVHA